MDWLNKAPLLDPEAQGEVRYYRCEASRLQLDRYAACGLAIPRIARISRELRLQIMVPLPENASSRDIRPLATLLAESLFHDPLEQWLFPDTVNRLASSELMFRRLLKQRVADGLVRVIRDSQGSLLSVAIWGAPYPPSPTRWQRYAESLFMRRLHGRLIHEVRRCATAMAARHPPQPYWYLQALATVPQHRGEGHARSLLEERFQECDASGLTLALETSNAANLPYYEYLGFQVVHELLLVDGLPVWLMCRSPNA